jgi:hypothetical protein
MKNLFKLLYLGFFSLVIGGMFSAYAGVDPAFAVPSVAALSVVGSHLITVKGLAMVGADVSAITSAFVEFGGQIFSKNVNSWVLDPAIALYRSVKKPMVLPKLSASGNPRPYTAADSVGTGAAFTDRTLTVYNSKWDYDLDPEQYRNSYLASQESNPYYQFILNQVAKEYLAQLNDNTLYLGSYSAAGTTAAAIATGWGTKIAAEITATNITPVTGAAITTSNAVAQVELVGDSAPAWMKSRSDVVMFCSWGTFEKYRTNYRASFGFNFEKNEQGFYKIDGKPWRLQPVSWMKTSQRLILTVNGNLIVGTDLEGVEVAASMRRNIVEVRQMMAVGLQIADLEALVVNDQA